MSLIFPPSSAVSCFISFIFADLCAVKACTSAHLPTKHSSVKLTSKATPRPKHLSTEPPAEGIPLLSTWPIHTTSIHPCWELHFYLFPAQPCCPAHALAPCARNPASLEMTKLSHAITKHFLQPQTQSWVALLSGISRSTCTFHSVSLGKVHLS